MRNTIIASMVAFIIGALASRFLAQSSIAEQRSKVEELRGELESKSQDVAERDKAQARLKKDLAVFAGIDLKSIEKIQDAEERAERLSNLVGELFMVLLSHALIPGTPSMPGEKREAVATDSKSTGGGQPEASSEGLQEKEASNENPQTPTSQETRPAAASSWAGSEGDISKVSVANADSFLSKVAISDLKAEMKGGRPHQPDDPRIEAIQGSFAGPITFLDQDKKRGKQTVELEINGRDVVKGNINGTYELRVFKDGQRIGRTAGNGNLDIRNTQSQSQALIMRASPEEFFQMYALPDGQHLIGNYYEAKALEEPKLVGRVVLQRN